MYCLIYDNLLRGINDPSVLLSLKKTPAKAGFYFVSSPLTSFFFFFRRTCMTNSAHKTSNKFLTSAKNYAELYTLGEKNSVVYTVDLDDSGAFEGTILYDT